MSEIGEYKWIDLIDKFKPLDEEQQMLLYFYTLSAMDFYQDLLDKAKTKKDREKFSRDIDNVEFISRLFMDDSDMEKETGYSNRKFCFKVLKKDYENTFKKENKS